MEIVKFSVPPGKTVRYDILKNGTLIASEFTRKNFSSAITVQHRNKQTGILHINLKNVFYLISFKRIGNIIKIVTKSNNSKVTQPLYCRKIFFWATFFLQNRENELLVFFCKLSRDRFGHSVNSCKKGKVNFFVFIFIQMLAKIILIFFNNIVLLLPYYIHIIC